VPPAKRIRLLVDTDARNEADDQMPAPAVAPDLSYRARPDNPRTIRIYRRIDARFVLEDLYAKLALAYG
jgi:hypothetical protein